MQHTKFRNRKAEYQGVWFDSIVERDRWIWLQEKEKSGEIKSLSRQTVLSFYCSDQSPHSTTHDNWKKMFFMKVDFSYIPMDDPGNADCWYTRYEDTKGKPTNDPNWNIKRKLIEQQQGITIIEVRWDKAKGDWVYKSTNDKRRSKKVNG